MNFSKKEYLSYAVSKIAPAKTEDVLKAAAEPLRKKEDEIEKLRDPSHIRNLSKKEMLALYHDNDLPVSCCEVTRMPMVLQNWLDHTVTPVEVQERIVTQMRQEISKGEKLDLSRMITVHKSSSIIGGC